MKGYKNTSMRRKLIYGTISGIIAGMVMLVTMTILMGMLKLPPTLFPMLLGTMVGTTGQAALIPGIGIHFLTSAGIGAIFGIVVSRITRLMITNFVKGLAFGITTGFIAFIVLFIPMSITVLPQNMMNLMNMMNPNMTQQQTMAMLQQKMPMMFGVGFLEHVIYGAVLGAVASILIIKVEMKLEKQATSKELS